MEALDHHGESMEQPANAVPQSLSRELNVAHGGWLYHAFGVSSHVHLCGEGAPKACHPGYWSSDWDAWCCSRRL